MKNCKKTTYRTAIMGASVFMMTVMFLGTGTNPKVAEAVSVASQQTKSSVDLKKMKDLYEQVQTGKRLEAAQEFVAQLLTMKAADVNNVLKSLPFKLKEKKFNDGYIKRDYDTDGISVSTSENHSSGNEEYGFGLKLEEKLTEPADLKVEFPLPYFLVFEEKMEGEEHAEGFETEEKMNEFKKAHPKDKIKQVLHITSWEQATEQLPYLYNENRESTIPMSEEQKHLLKGWLDTLKKYGFKKVSGDIMVCVNHLGKFTKVLIHDGKFYKNHHLAIELSSSRLSVELVPLMHPNKIDPNHPSA